ncbi:hypothetical protein EC973_000702 [Apophysomyces ossiformis]|uniref:Uncharacterized protein n=1 Tax=Apophysomyces ossiformis TaxID=679940 RepID=A0A8H7BIW5_9FUNG|nr:hypothetical protein EC973_000702 [Apophysomyces ossiformis]
MAAFDPRRRSISNMLWMIFILAVSVARAQDTTGGISATTIPTTLPCTAGGNCSSAVVNATSTASSNNSTLVPTTTTASLSNTVSVPSLTPTNSNGTSSSLPPPITYMPIPSVDPTGWNGNTNAPPSNNESWLKQHNRFVFVIVLGVLVLSLIIWYIVKSVRGMQKRLERENQAQMLMIQQATGGARIIPETEGYKMDTLPPPAQASSSPPRY